MFTVNMVFKSLYQLNVDYSLVQSMGSVMSRTGYRMSHEHRRVYFKKKKSLLINLPEKTTPYSTPQKIDRMKKKLYR